MSSPMNPQNQLLSEQNFLGTFCVFLLREVSLLFNSPCKQQNIPFYLYGTCCTVFPHPILRLLKKHTNIHFSNSVINVSQIILSSIHVLWIHQCLDFEWNNIVKQNNLSNSNSSLLEYKTCSTFRIYSNLRLKRCKLDRCLYK